MELANGPTTPGAHAVLNKNDVLVVPDFLATSGGVTMRIAVCVVAVHRVADAVRLACVVR